VPCSNVVEDELNIDTELETSGDIDVWNAKKCRRCLHLEPGCRAGRQEADAEEATPSRGSTTTALEIWQPKWPMLQSDVGPSGTVGRLVANHKSRLFQVHLLTRTLSWHFIAGIVGFCLSTPIIDTEWLWDYNSINCSSSCGSMGSSSRSCRTLPHHHQQQRHSTLSLVIRWNSPFQLIHISS
jgi:hypothetical protein